MAIQYIESINVDGKGNSPQRKLFNGYIYSLNYNVGLADSKSYVTINVVSEDGEYSISPSDLNYSRVYPISIGSNIKFNGYLVKYRKVNEGQKLLELKFVDTSAKLDRYFVGIKNIHGKESKDNILILGREFHPCDFDFDGDLEEIPDIIDECHPCRNQAKKEAEFNIVNCKDRNKYTIFPVKYNFTMLLEELSKHFKFSGKIKDPNPKYYTDYSGTVRDVLLQWCGDFGWIFYWEDETIKFLDLRKTIDINVQINDFCPNLSGIEEEFSIEDTRDRIVASYYKRAGSNDEHRCLDAMYFQIPVYEPNRIDLGAELQITTKIPHIAAGLMQYSDGLRDLWYWFDYYGLREPKYYKPGKYMPKVGLTILGPPILLSGEEVVPEDPEGLETSGGLDIGSAESSSLEPSTGLFTPNCFPTNPEPSSDLEFLSSAAPTEELQLVQALIRANPRYRMCFELLNAEDQWVVANGLAKNKEDFFFFVGYYDIELHNEHKREEGEYGSEFLNRYHIMVPDLNDPKQRTFFEDYLFRQDEICNIKMRTNDSKIQYSFLAVGSNDSATYYNNPGMNSTGDVDTLSSLTFKEWLKIFRDTRDAPTARNRERMFKLLVVEKSNAMFYPSSVKYNEEPDEEKIKDEIKNSKLIDLAKKNSLVIIQERNNAAGEFIPRKLLDGTKYQFSKSLDRSKVYVLIGRAVGKTDYRVVTQNAINPTILYSMPFNGKPIVTEFENEFDLQGETVYAYEDLKCKEIGSLNPFCYRRSFKTPVATFTYYEPGYSPYGVVVEKEKVITNKVPKLELQILDKTKISDKVARIEVDQNNISDEAINVFYNKNNTCKYDIKKIKEYHDKISGHLSFVYDKPIESKQFVIEGITLNKTPKIGNGLINIDVSLSDDGSVRTTYTLGTRLMVPISPEFFKSLNNATQLKTELNLNPVSNIRPTSYEPS